MISKFFGRTYLFAMLLLIGLTLFLHPRCFCLVVFYICKYNLHLRYCMVQFLPLTHLMLYASNSSKFSISIVSCSSYSFYRWPASKILSINICIQQYFSQQKLHYMVVHTSFTLNQYNKYFMTNNILRHTKYYTA